ELDIFDIPIRRLTARYLESLDLMRDHGIEPASDFLVMAATLLRLKSQLLLPKRLVDDELDTLEIDPRAALVRQLLEYQIFKEAAGQIAERPWVGRELFTRPGGQDRPRDPEAELATLDAYRLAQAFRGLMNRPEYRAPHDIYVERITIGERMAQIGDRLATKGKLSFAALCMEAQTSEEVITTFLALLEMARLRLIRVVQRKARAPLYIESRVDDIGMQGERAAGMLVETND
ncbi:MAG: segregation/condensation protein A, partial [Myxococcota bacterium]|nr:segregation/condensation protein A [Myxococcota bacterium]